MSLDPDLPSTTTNRDWIFPSQSFNLPRTLAWRFSSSYPRTKSFQNPLSQPPSNSTPAAIPPNSTTPVEGRGFQLGRRRNGWAGVKWRVRENDEGGGEDDTNGERILVMCFAYLVHKSFSLQNQVNHLQNLTKCMLDITRFVPNCLPVSSFHPDELSKLNIRLRRCNISDSMDIIDST
uniref:Uncharacterized protein n=1 Tax=Solanum lycopersicum TaxID=4081 RepID=A0A3Q7FI11_SOLLC